MKNILNFYYDLKIDDINIVDNSFYFVINENEYIFKVFYGDLDNIMDIYRINLYMINFIDMDRIILNKNGTATTTVDGTFYILILKGKMNNLIDLTTIRRISSINIPSIKKLERNNWELLWSNLIDYYEMQIGQNEKKYPLIRESFDYYVGMAENAISYLVNTKKEVTPDMDDIKVIAHNSLYYPLSDPLNIIFDHKSRDIAEYIKISFFNDDKHLFKNLDEYFYYNRFSLYGIRVLLARIIYPSFYFKLYDDIIKGNKDEKELNFFINNTDKYEEFLYNIYLYLNKFYNIPEIEWLKKRDINSRL